MEQAVAIVSAKQKGVLFSHKTSDYANVLILDKLQPIANLVSILMALHIMDKCYFRSQMRLKPLSISESDTILIHSSLNGKTSVNAARLLPSVPAKSQHS